ncbi:galectin-8 isoform X1 [Phyllostomus discolor]|uniref:Galectin n=1 Tax=Phyllostomus discolor TaxID=89673 RepID=A0A7E6CYB5_9CHIR|nr:galectin-8 isoform X1 [Phyllostomus discolor]XP_035872053.1 galectin-8 isoform X1 [Phyllostomus discolor]XP_035872054.1 galectin-8 isoform X1 [Phyllostomus discolor]
MLSLNNLQNVITNPVIPYVGTISEQLEPGTLIVIRGHVPGDSDRFQVDFQSGSSVKPRADVVFHFNPRFKRSNCIVCNTLKNEKWGREEITYDMPFTKEKSFEIVIMVLKDKFQVAVNGKHTLLYAHRISPEKIDTLGIYGAVNIHSVGFSFSSVSALPSFHRGGPSSVISGEMGDLRSSPAPTLELTEIRPENVQNAGMSQFPSNRGDTGKIVPRTVCTKSRDSTASLTLTCAKILPINSLSKTLPFVARLNSSMGPGRTVVIKGEVNAKAKSFNVDLISGKSKDIALHLNPRLNIKAFVRNSFLQESWGEEERNITCFPFSTGMYFEMIIYCDVKEFKVAVNGVHCLEYKHRFKELSNIDTLEIDGDIHLLEVRSW